MAQQIRKAVIPVAGLGTRLLPLSKSTPKELVAVVDRPAIQWVIDEAVASGITEIILVTSPAKAAIEHYLKPDEALEADLTAKNKTALVTKLKGILPEGVAIKTVFQNEPKGLGHAVLMAKELVGNEAFAVLLPDVLVVKKEGQGAADLAQMITRFNEVKSSQILVAPVPHEKVSSYGIVDVGGKSLEAGQSTPMTAVVEKPAPEVAPSNLSVVGRYLLPAQIFTLLENTAPGAGGEIQLTDAILSLMGSTSVEAYQLVGKTYDCGDMFGLFEAQLSLALTASNNKEQYQAIVERVLNTVGKA